MACPAFTPCFRGSWTWPAPKTLPDTPPQVHSPLSICVDTVPVIVRTTALEAVCAIVLALPLTPGILPPNGSRRLFYSHLPLFYSAIRGALTLDNPNRDNGNDINGNGGDEPDASSKQEDEECIDNAVFFLFRFV